MSKEKKYINVIVICILFFTILFLRYIRALYQEFYPIALFLLFLSAYNLNFKIRKNNKLSLVIGMVFLMFLLLSIGNDGFGKNMINNLLLNLLPISLPCYFASVAKGFSKKELFSLSRRILLVLNAYFVLNVPIIITQYITGSFMMKRFLSWGLFAFDQMTGFMGGFGTGILNVYWIVLISINILYSWLTKKKSYMIWSLIIMIVMFILSNMNEIKSFLPSAIIIIFITYFLRFFSSSNFLKIAGRIFILFVFFSFISFFLYQRSELVKNLIDIILESLMDYSLNTMPTTHNERAYLTWLVFNHYNGFKFGVGLNSFDLITQVIHKNIAINSFVLPIFQGGIFYFLSIWQIYVCQMYSSIKNSKMKVNIRVVLYIILSVFVYFIALFTQPFRDFYVMFFIGIWLFYACLFVNRDEDLELEM
ncbi:hypothetical protein ABE945_02260 [Enterococcus gilvus]|uniref:hypothetical protein n=1 Tax=Enterococcus gilvus TaxID=160453 RepID=UPI003D6BFB0F